jgi:hypothetical protein
MLPIALDLPACGLRAFFYWGVYRGLMQQQKWTIERIYGRSSGAIVGAFILCDLPEEDLVNIYQDVQEANHTLYIVDCFYTILAKRLPPNAYAICSGRLFITAAILGCIPITTSVFRDNVHLLDTIRTSGSLPFITTSRLYLADQCPLPILDGCFIDCLGNARNLCGTCDGPGKCSHTKTLHVLRVSAPVCAWPEYIPVKASCHPFTTTQLAVRMGMQFVEHSELRWSHVRY